MLIPQPFSNHNGGQIAFAPNGRLYIGTGDGGSGGDPGNVAQRMSSRLGKMLSLNVNRKGAKPAIVGLGLRNPWRFSFDRKTGALYIADVGQDKVEEIDYVAASRKGLQNYGWDASRVGSRSSPATSTRRADSYSRSRRMGEVPAVPSLADSSTAGRRFRPWSGATSMATSARDDLEPSRAKRQGSR